MKILQEHAGRTLRWTQPHALQRVHELRAGADVLATLRWERWSFCSRAHASSARHAWTFERGGFLRPRVTVRGTDPRSGQAVLATNWRGGATLQVEGRAYRWSSIGLCRSAWSFATDSGEPLLRFATRFALLRHDAVVMIEPAGRSSPDLDLLVLLGEYLLVLTVSDAAAAVAAAMV